jgi:hypothetical protein
MKLGSIIGIAIVGIFGFDRVAFATNAPVLYRATFHQSPVRGEPDDVLLLAGSGFSSTDRVVYTRLGDTTQPLVPPASVPTTSTDVQGVASVVDLANPPDPLDSLTVKLPTVMTPGSSYALWVVNANSQWSAGIKINDARPLWISPEVAYVSAALPGLPRQLKVIGRNLQSMPGSTTKVRLSSPATTFVLVAADDGNETTTIEHYVAKIPLPSPIPPGVYTVSVQRDGVSWVPLAGQNLTVVADPGSIPTFNVSSFGGCAANDGLDDTACVQAAVAAAAASPCGGTVVFGPGTWDLINSSQLPNPGSGIVLQEGVGLTTVSGSTPATIRKSASWNSDAVGAATSQPVFTVQGRNQIASLRFEDARTYVSSDPWSGFFALGIPIAPSSSIADVLFANNVFAGPYIGITGNGYPVKHLYVVNNEFGAYYNGIRLDGIDSLRRLRVDDSIINGNTFKPGAFLLECTQGTVATEIGASSHLDYSGNSFMGTATDYLGANPVLGWVGGSFFHTVNNHETTLVSQNFYSCTGDKGGNGEAIVYDENGNTFGFAAAKAVSAATANSVTVSTADGMGLLATQNGNPEPVDTYYSDHWVRISNGRGLGQVRKIASYSIDTSAQTVVFNVTPDWDVPPDMSSNLVVEREAWQTYTVDNEIDNRDCMGVSESGDKKQGTIGLQASAADSTIEGNDMHQAGGILGWMTYQVDLPPSMSFPQGWSHGVSLQSFIDVRRNTIEGEVDYASNCSIGGINWSYAALTGPDVNNLPPSPVVEGYGISIANNSVTHADGVAGGAISLTYSWRSPPNSHSFEHVLIHHNSISDLAAPAPDRLETTTTSLCKGVLGCLKPIRDVGIFIQEPVTYWTVLYKNASSQVATPVLDDGSNTMLDFRSKLGDFASNGVWGLRQNELTPPGPANIANISWGSPGDRPVVGNWSGWHDKIGVYRNGTWLLDYNGNGVWDNGIDLQYSWGGLAQDIPVVGRWRDNDIAKIGVYRNGTWLLDYNGNGVWDSTDGQIVWGGQPGDIPVVGNWKSSGAIAPNYDKVGIFRSGHWLLDVDGNGTWSSMDVDFYWGDLPGDVPVVGDWNGDGYSKIGVYRNGTWLLDFDGDGQWNDQIDLVIVDSINQPVVGRW